MRNKKEDVNKSGKVDTPAKSKDKIQVEEQKEEAIIQIISKGDHQNNSRSVVDKAPTPTSVNDNK